MFKALVTLGSVTSGTASNGSKFKKSSGTVEFGGKSLDRTIMAFGPALEKIGGQMRKGRKIEAMVEIRRGTVKIIGPVATKAA